MKVSMGTGVSMKQFLPCENSLEVPESMCQFCGQSILAPSPQALQEAQNSHCCPLSVSAGLIAAKLVG